MTKNQKILLLKLSAIIAGIIPLAWLIYLIFAQKLSADPAKDIQHFTGTTTINFLLATLMLSPFVQITHWNIFNNLRRTLGLTTFFWATAHITSYLMFELAGDINLFFSEITSRTYLILGAIAWLGLFTLALTSNKLSIRALKKHWKSLHNLVYPIAILGGLHYYIALKVKGLTPIIYLIFFIVLWGNHLIRKYRKHYSR